MVAEAPQFNAGQLEALWMVSTLPQCPGALQEAPGPVLDLHILSDKCPRAQCV